MTTIIDFLTKHEILWFPIILNIKDKPIDDPFIEGLKKKDKIIQKINHPLYKREKEGKDGKKYLSSKPEYTDFWKFDKTDILKRQQLYFNNDLEFNAIWIDTREYPQVDLDCPIECIGDEELKAYIDGLIEDAPHYPSMTKPYAFHFFCSLDSDENRKPKLDKLMYKFKDSKGNRFDHIDFLCGQSAYAPINATINNFNGDMEEWDETFHVNEFIFKDKTKKQVVENHQNQNFKKAELKGDLYAKFWDYFNLIDNSVIGNYEGWFNCSCIHKNIIGEDDFERFDAYCKQFDKYEEDNNKYRYDNIKDPKAGWKKLYELAFCCNPNGKKTLDEKYKEPAFSIAKFVGIKSKLTMDDELQNKFDTIDDFNSKKQKQIKKEYEERQKEIEDDLYKKRKYYFEKYHAKILNPFSFIRVYENDVSVYKKQSLKDMYENLPNKFIENWLKDMWIKTYEKMDFLPKPLEVKNDVYNTFKGFRIEKMIIEPDNDIDIFLNQIRLLVGKDEAGYEYMIKYLAHLVQMAGELPCVMLLFRSIQQGVGKNLFFEKISEKMIGRDYYVSTADIDKIIGRFSVINKKFMICLDEAHGRDTFSNSDKIKNIITGEKITMETKGVDAFDIRNVGRYIVFSNNTNPMPIDASDRRIVAFECNCDMAGNVEYFNKLAKALDNDSKIKGFYNYLKDIDISGWRPHVNRPKTEFYKELKQANMGIDKKFMKFYYDNNSTTSVIKIKSCELYDRFVDYCENEEMIQQQKIMKQTKFSTTVKTQFSSCVEFNRKKDGMYFTIHIDKLKIHLIDKLDFEFYEDSDDEE